MKKIVTISGGSGGFVVCRALRRYPFAITAIPSVFDSGGSTGVLRDAYGALPKGDVRRCLLALMPEAAEQWRDLMGYRFSGDGPLGEHSLGNVLLYAAEQLWGRVGGIDVLANLLRVDGRVVPVSSDDADLCAELSDGTVLHGEAVIDTRSREDTRSLARLFLSRPAMATREAIDAIKAADIIVLSPGDLFTSLLPNFLVKGVTEALSQSSAKLVYVVNLMTKSSETCGYSAEDFLKQLYVYGLRRPVDYVVVNNADIPEDLQISYLLQEGSEKVMAPRTAWHDDMLLFRRCITTPLVSARGLSEGLVRHSTNELGRVFRDISLGLYEMNVIIDLDDTLIMTTEHGLSGDPGLPPLMPDARMFLEAVTGKRCLLTAGDPVFQLQKMRATGLADLFDDVCIVEKKEEKSAALDALIASYPTNATLVVDDRPDGMLPCARAFGFHTIRFAHETGKYRHATHRGVQVMSYRELLDRYARLSTLV